MSNEVYEVERDPRFNKTPVKVVDALRYDCGDVVVELCCKICDKRALVLDDILANPVDSDNLRQRLSGALLCKTVVEGVIDGLKDDTNAVLSDTDSMLQ